MIFFNGLFRVLSTVTRRHDFLFVLLSLLMNIYVVSLVFHNDILRSLTKKGCPVIKKKKNKSNIKEKNPKRKWIPYKEAAFIIHLLAFFTNNFAELRPYALTNVQYKFSSNRLI